MSIQLVMPSNQSHPLSSPSHPTFNLSKHQGLFQWVSSSHQVAKVLKFQASASVLPKYIQVNSPHCSGSQGLHRFRKVWASQFPWEKQGHRGPKDTAALPVFFRKLKKQACLWHQEPSTSQVIASMVKSYFFFSHSFFFPFIFINWRLITLQYCSGFCHTLTWISHGFTCVPHPNPPSHLPLHPIPLGLPSAPAQNTCLMHPTWAGDLFHPW